MYYQNYEDYMRSILGYPVRQNEYMPTYENYNNISNSNTEYVFQTPNYSSEIMNLYPEIYKIINPMVCKICEANTKPINRELIEKMTDEIYLNIESDPSLAESDIVNVRVNLPKENSKSNNSTSSKSKSSTTEVKSKRIRDSRNEKSENKVEQNNLPENRESRPIRRNNTLRDLIKILILNQLLRGNVRPHRPNPPRPPYPGRPGQNPRPPIQPRNIFPNNQWC